MAARLIYLQLIEHHHYVVEARGLRYHPQTITAQRGDIVDRNGIPLAISVPVATVTVDPTEVDFPEQTGALLASVYPNKAEKAVQIAAEITADQGVHLKSGLLLRYLNIDPSMSYDRANALQQLMHSESIAHANNVTIRPDFLSGVNIKWKTIRNYPNGSLAAQILGFPSLGKGGVFEAKYGVEASQNPVLAGKDGYTYMAYDDARRPIPGTGTTQIPVQNGQTLRLTIDSRIQALAEEDLNKSCSISSCGFRKCNRPRSENRRDTGACQPAGVRSE